MRLRGISRKRCDKFGTELGRVRCHEKTNAGFGRVGGSVSEDQWKEETKSNKGMITTLREKRMGILKASMIYAYLTPSPLVWLGWTGILLESITA